MLRRALARLFVFMTTSRLIIRTLEIHDLQGCPTCVLTTAPALRGEHYSQYCSTPMKMPYTGRKGVAKVLPYKILIETLDSARRFFASSKLFSYGRDAFQL